jgi:RNA polymerase sigma-70 factor (ECF subfamily)
MVGRVIPLRRTPRAETDPSVEAVQEASPERSSGPPPPLDFDDAFETYAPYIGSIVLRMVGRDADVEDIVQDVFVSALRGRHTLRDPSGIRPWLATIAVNVTRRYLRRRKLRRVFGLDAGGVDIAAPGASPEQRMLLLEVFRILDGVPIDERIAWSLRYLAGERLEDVAAFCDCSLATAKRRIAIAAAKLEEATGHA